MRSHEDTSLKFIKIEKNASKSTLGWFHSRSDRDWDSKKKSIEIAPMQALVQLNKGELQSTHAASGVGCSERGL